MENEKTQFEKAREKEVADAATSLENTLKKIAEFGGQLTQIKQMLKARNIAFETVEGEFIEAIDLAESFQPYMSSLRSSYSMLNDVNRGFGVLSNTMNEVQKFTPGNQGRPDWQQLAQNFTGMFRDEKPQSRDQSPTPQNIARRLRAILSYLRSKEYEAESLPTLTSAVKGFHDTSKTATVEITELLEKVRDAPARWTLAKYATKFRNAAYRHTAGAYGSLLVAAALAHWAYSIVSGWLTAEAASASSQQSITVLPTAAWFVGRIFTLSLFSFAILAAIKNFRTNKHLEVLNTHRANVLSTYDLLISSAPEAETKSVLLREAASAIFTAGSTGYVGVNDANPDQQITEILREMLVKKVS